MGVLPRQFVPLIRTTWRRHPCAKEGGSVKQYRLLGEVNSGFWRPSNSQCWLWHISKTGRATFLCRDQVVLLSASPILHAAAYTSLRLFLFSASCFNYVCMNLLIFPLDERALLGLAEIAVHFVYNHFSSINFCGITESWTIKDHKNNPF